jgi:hypothetical protein
VNNSNVGCRADFTSDHGHPVRAFGHFCGETADKAPPLRGLRSVVNLFAAEMEKTEWLV